MLSFPYAAATDASFLSHFAQGLSASLWLTLVRPCSQAIGNFLSFFAALCASLSLDSSRDLLSRLPRRLSVSLVFGTWSSSLFRGGAVLGIDLKAKIPSFSSTAAVRTLLRNHDKKKEEEQEERLRFLCLQ